MLNYYISVIGVHRDNGRPTVITGISCPTVPDVQAFWDEAMAVLSDGHVLTNHSSALLPDLGGDVLTHSIDQSAPGGSAWAAIDALVAASSAGVTLGADVVAVDVAAIRNVVAGIGPEIITNVLRRARGPTNEAQTRRLVADELLTVIEMLIEQVYADGLVGEVLEFARLV